MADKKKRAGRHKEAPGLANERKLLLSSSSGFYTREAYKALRTNVTFSLSEVTGCRVITVTSALRNEGKSLTSLNLAISYAMAEQRVLLIDCDLRLPKVYRLLQLPNTEGLTDVLMDPSLLDRAIHHSETHGIDVLLTGSIPPNPSELLGSRRMAQVLETCRQRYDYIILDSPPVNLVTDPAVLIPQSDGALFVVRAGQSERGSVMSAVSQLELVDAKILGFVLNGIDSSTGNRYGKYRYGKYYRRGYYGYGYGRTPSEKSDG